MDILSQLNESQRKAVEYVDGASLVIAGAGSGKTRVLTFKIAYLILNGYKPWEIMALTFTNKAAKEMKERIMSLVGEEARYLQMGTFHSVFARILRREASRIGYDANFTIYDESDSRSLCKSIVKQLELDDKVYKPTDVHNRISWAKNKLMMPEQYAQNEAVRVDDVQKKMSEMPHIYKMYMDNCRKSNAMDFDDLLLYTFLLFRDYDEVRKSYSERYRFLLVDEYQDTNYAQQQIVWQLSGEHQHVCVVGDDAQSIYGFRGANIDNILDFQQQYKNSQLFKLEQNYRSTQRIVQAANSLILHNNRQIRKDVYSRNDEGDKLVLRILASDREESINVCKDIRRSVRSGARYSDFAILYRTNYQSRTFEEQMLKENIPYRIYGGMSFYQRKEIKDVLGYFRLVVNPHDEEAFRRVINYPARGIGDTTVAKLAAAAQAYGESLWTICSNPVGFGVKVNKGTITKIMDFREMIMSFTSRLDSDDAFLLGQEIIKKSGITADIYSGINPDDISRQENLDEFLSSLQDFVEGNKEEGNPTGLVEFLQDVSLMSDKDNKAEDDNNRVTLMTVHSAKGLEFPQVYVVGMEENIFPSPLCTNSVRQLEEERRLLYVAITRAEKKCILTCAKSRYRYGRMEFDAPSRFLRDIDPRLLSVEDTSAGDSMMERSVSRGGYSGSSYSGFSGGYLQNREGLGRARSSSGGTFDRGNARMQNSHPVASQFFADQKPKITSSRRTEQAVNPYSEAFERKLKESGANMRRVYTSLSTGAPSVLSGIDNNGITHSIDGGFGFSEGDTVMHARFGRGVIKSVEGNGDSSKATVEFVSAGTKQLLLKYAKLTKMN